MGDGVAGSDWTYQQATDIRAMELWALSAYLEAYAAWLSLDQVEKKIYPMPEKPAVG